MEADTLRIHGSKHPVVDKIRATVTGFRAGKVAKGEPFMWRGEDLSKAPKSAHAVDPDEQAAIEQARVEAKEAAEMAERAKVAQGAALAASAAAAVFRGVEAPAQAPARTGWPKGKPRGPRKHTPEPVPSSPGEGS
jgi:hypothetical protein